MNTEFVATLKCGDRVLRTTRNLGHYWLHILYGDEVWTIISISPKRSRIVVRREVDGAEEAIQGNKLQHIRPIDSEFEARYIHDTCCLQAKQQLSRISNCKFDLSLITKLTAEEACELTNAAMHFHMVAERLGVIHT